MAKNSPILLKSKAFRHKVNASNLSPNLWAFLLRLNGVEKCKKMACTVSWAVSWAVKKQKKNRYKLYDEY